MRRNRSKAAGAADLPPDMLANIHARLSPLDRLAFAAAFPASRGAFKPEAPWLVLPGGDDPDTATLFSLSDRSAATLRAPEPALRGHVVLGSSSGGWLVTADDRARMRLINPVTGDHRALPAITTIPSLLEKWGGFSFMMLQPKDFLRGPPYHGGGDRPTQGTFTIGAELMRRFFYRKVVLSDSAAMLITGPRFGVPAFATAEGGVWRLAPSREGVEDAVHYNGKFHSITYTGAVEAWEQDADTGGVFTSTVVAPRPRLPNVDGDSSLCRRKYLMAAPGGRLMVVLKETKEETTDEYSRPRRTCSFKVQVLDGERWKETEDIGDAALFVGVNSSLCVSTREHPELRAGCVYYTENDTELCKDGHNADEDNRVGVYSLEVGWTGKIEGLGQHRSWPPPAWFIPAIP